MNARALRRSGLARRCALAACAFVVALEGALQLGAWIGTLTIREHAASAGAQVLCVGDSFTFGIGASSPAASYPALLPRALQELGAPSVAVDNAGFPGHHSGDVLRKLGRQLTPATRVVCVLVGANDSWRHPEPVPADELDANAPAVERFVWTWRTGRLLALLFRFEAGSWRAPIEASASPAAPAELPPPNAPATTAEDRRVGFELLARHGLPTPEKRVGRYEPDRTLPTERNAAFARAMQAGDGERALAIAEQSQRAHPDSPLALQHVVAAALRLGQRERALTACRALAALRTRQPSGAATECLIDAWLSCGDPEPALALARERIAEQPLSIPAWDGLQRAAFVLGRRDDVARAMPEVVRLLGRTEPERTAFIARNFARTLVPGDAGKAAALLLGAHRIDGNTAETRIALGVTAAHLQRAAIDAAVAELPRADDARTREFVALYAAIARGEDDAAWTAVLRQHLAAMHARLQRHGLAMVVVGYPFAQPSIEQAQRDAAAALGVPFVATREAFTEALRARPDRELFAPDGHCNDAGNALVAQRVAAAILQRLR